LGNALAIPLGILAAALGLLVGPASQVIIAPRDTAFKWTELFNDPIAGWVASAVGSPAITWNELLGILPAALLGVAALKALCTLAQWYLWERTGERVSMAMRRDVVGHFLLVDPSTRRRPEVQNIEAELSSGISNDIRLLREYIVHFYGGLPREGLQAIFLIVTLAMLSPKLLSIFLIALAPAGFLISRYGKKLRRRASRALEDYSALTEWLQQRLMGIETIKHYRTELLESERMKILNAALLKRFLRANWTKAQTSPMIEALGVFAMVLVLHMAFDEIRNGAASGSVLLSFFATLGWFSQSTARLGKYVNSNREAAAAVKRLQTTLSVCRANEKRAIGLVAEHAPELHLDGMIACDRISLTYAGTADAALKGFSYTFESGKIYCIAGRSGAGKSTLFNLLLGARQPDEGSIRAVTKKSCDHIITCMPQRVQLAPDSIAANVVWPNLLDGSPAEQERILRALLRVGLGDDISALPSGVLTRVGIGGQGVSGGQAQRLQLARLAYHETPFVLIDEGTSALDPETERTVFRLVEDLAARGAGVIMIAHRLAATTIADEVLVLDRGRLVMSGPAAEVVRAPVFTELAGAQP